jgi:hypothetical protein
MSTSRSLVSIWNITSIDTTKQKWSVRRKDKHDWMKQEMHIKCLFRDLRFTQSHTPEDLKPQNVCCKTSREENISETLMFVFYKQATVHAFNYTERPQGIIQFRVFVVTVTDFPVIYKHKIS